MKRGAQSSNFYMPLRGGENQAKLAEKYEQYWDSDEDNEPQESDRGKVSDWKLDDSQWLQSKGTQRGTPASGYRPATKAKTSKTKVVKESVSQFGRNKDRKDQTTPSKYSPPHKESQGTLKDVPRSRELSDDGGRKVNVVTDDFIENYSSSDEEVEVKEESGDRVGPSKTGSAVEGSKIGSTVEGFSLSDTERPKLAVSPVAAKVDFRLSADGVEPPVQVPATINQYLRDYQRDGIRFLYQHYVNNTGAILGDDMGLGKTIQVIGFLSALLGKKGNHKDVKLPKFIRQLSGDQSDSPPAPSSGPFLIIGPSAVLYNWLDELNTWGYFTASKYHGADKDACLKDVGRGKLEIVVTTFDTFRDNVAILNEIVWDAVIVDEVHKIKGLRAQVTQTLRIINTPRRYGLTGTALQNNMTELWSILDWAQPGVLGNLEQFENEYVQVIETGQRHDASKRELALARKQKDKFSRVRRKMMIRRTKALIAQQLPSKEDLVVMCRLSQLQESVYKAILTHPDMELVLRAEDPCDCRKGKLRASCCYKLTSDGSKVWAVVLSFMHLLLKAANHMALLIPDGSTSKKQTERAQSVCDLAFRDYPQFVQQTRSAVFRTLSDPSYCGKMKILQGLLSVFSAHRDKVLIFSYSTRLLDIIEQYVIGQGHEYRRIDGKVSSQKRRDIVHQFNKDGNIFLCLISTKAGGLGLNLTGANRVVIFDPNWNPSHDLQAQDRAYRIGQTRDVKVYRLVSAGTIEENVYLRQVYKQQLDEVAVGTGNARRYFLGIQGDKDNKGELFGIKNMFSLRTGNSCLTMDILKRNEKLEKGLASFSIAQYIPPRQAAGGGEDSENESDSGGGVGDGGGGVSEGEVSSDEEREEDEQFLRELFGSDRIPLTVHGRSREKIHGSKKRKRDSVTDDSRSLVRHADVLEDEDSSLRGDDEDDGDNDDGGDDDDNNNSDDDDDGFPFLRRLRHKLQTPPPRQIQTDSNVRCPDSSETHGEGSPTVSDITFSTAAPRTEIDIPTTREAAGDSLTFSSPGPSRLRAGSNRRSTTVRSGLSWLFSSESEGSVDEETDEKSLVKSTSDNKVANVVGVTKSIKTSTVNKAIDEAKVSKSPRLKDKHAHCVGKGRERDKFVDEKKEASKRNVEVADPKGKSSSAISSSSKKRKFSSELSVLESEGVLHTHINPRVVGSSKAEDHMTRCAMQDVFELHTNTQAPAVQCDPLIEEEEEKEDEKKASKLPGRTKGGVREEEHNKPRCVKSGSFKLLLGQTPPTITRQHWQELCESRGLDQVAMAQSVLELSVEERADMLREFYCRRHPQLTDALTAALTPTPKLPAPKESVKVKKSVKKPPRLRQTASTKNKSSESTGRPRSGRGKGKSAVSHPAKSRRTSRGGRRRDHLMMSSLFYAETMRWESQESVTAHSPDRDLDDCVSQNSEGFAPVPHAQRRRAKTPSPKPSPSKSGLTRIRRKGQSSSSRDRDNTNLFAPSCSYVPTTVDPSLSTIVDELQSCEDVESRSLQDNSVCPTTTEDVDDLLVEIGKRSSQTANRRKVGHGEANPAPSSSSSSSAWRTKTGRSEREGRDTSRAKSGRKTYKSLLDNIFSLSSGDEDMAEPLDAEKKEQTCVNKDPPHKSETEKRVQIDVRTSQKSNTRSTSSRITEPDLSAVATSSRNFSIDRAGPETSAGHEEEENSDQDNFDDFLNNSTLRDDRIDCFAPSDKKKSWRKTPLKSTVHFSWKRRLNNMEDLEREDEGQTSWQRDQAGEDVVLDDSDSLFS
ncbi:DNA excision repair protein ERCC-6-like 2 [Aplysia californica]|uniref:DNA excision repair protein ERCC-6-like 2 n=1 Tax=Aplysia californica TaxID=6500 RepID=A0ABM0K7F4_APLCA|nr:DNA excision repair protein ERCC-6-like 2 [Aplysia californica]